MRLILCCCGYKILTAEDGLGAEDLRSLRKLAQKKKFHFAVKHYELCPSCSRDLKEASINQEIGPNDGDLGAKTIDLIGGGSVIIEALRKSVDHYELIAKSMAATAAAISEHQIDLAAKAGVNINHALSGLATAVQSIRDQADSFLKTISEARLD